MSRFKKLVITLAVAITITSPLYASFSSPFSMDVENNPAKLFFLSDSLFVGELTFKDLFADNTIENPIFKHPSLDANVLILGGLFALKLGATVEMNAKNSLYSFEAVMKRYMNIAFSVGYKMFSFGAGLTLSDERMHSAEFNKNIPFLSFIWESYFTNYADIPGSTDAFLNLSLMVSDKQYFGVSVSSPNFLRFNTTDPVFDWTSLYKNLDFSLFLKSPDYNKNDDLNVVVSSLIFDAIGIIGDSKKLSINNIISLVLSPDMKVNLLNTIDFIFEKGKHFAFTDDAFLHTLALEFSSKRFIGSIGFELPPSVYRGESSAFSLYIKCNILL